MTDKKKTLLWIIEGESNLGRFMPGGDTCGTSELINELIKGGNTQTLVLRKKSLEEQHGVFNAVTSLSQIDGADLN